MTEGNLSISEQIHSFWKILKKPQTEVREQEPPRGSVLDVHFKRGRTDGVSLQAGELSGELGKRNWNVYACASGLPEGIKGLRLESLSYQSPEMIALRHKIFPNTKAPEGDEAKIFEQKFANMNGEELASYINEQSEGIKNNIERYVGDNNINMLHIRNIMSLPLNLPATVAIRKFMKERSDLQFVCHHHDHPWEGPNAKSFETPYIEISEMIDKNTYPAFPNVRHIVINTIAQKALKERKGIDAVFIPDGFDFNRPVEKIDTTEYRKNLKILAGDNKPVTDNDLVVGMMARVAINKSIELSIQFAAELQKKRNLLENAADGVGANKRKFGKDSRVVLALGQGEDISEHPEYLEKLEKFAEYLGVTLAYAGDMVVPDNKYIKDGVHFPFYGTYQALDFVAYSPEHEGFGNQAVEAVWAKKPVAILEYPVFETDVKNHLPNYVSLGHTRDLETDEVNGLRKLKPEIVDSAVDSAINVLTDHDCEAEWVNKDFATLREFCGIDHVTDKYMKLYEDLKQKKRYWQ
jgi:mannosylglucosylglycerate synthase